MATFLTVFARAVFRTQPKVYGIFFAKIVNNLVVKLFRKKTHKCSTVFQKRLRCL